jgi:hypothetical protein
MNVLVRNTRTDKAIRMRRSTLATRPNAELQTTAVGARAESRRRLQPPTQDTALYNCHCGFVFEAAVTTSVDCPHCGGGQAW